ncbi:peptide MFS transporter [Actinomadura algeriensis]|uniref:POT family proton-dependent oligopeptide transporter n=1 Tax=Actinomadura algeriensis TaxID=1679523 RepID=A0ABR9K0K1_9ACTN|nr:peptide MFS transporter [Actinomadura algeriensis]MBE1536163.1 POT family proton-dependent oligopeptide transporter [Actinomadura algeriensis]
MAGTSVRGERTFFGHPWGLATLFFTEMWERFSFYGLRGILVLFLIAPPAESGLDMEEGTAKALLGVYMSMVYFVALPGGWIADRILGARRAVLWGCVIIMLGHVSMAIPAGAATVYLGLLLIILGTGLLKPNISTMVGKLYEGQDDARRDAGFSIFYMGINIGSLAPFLVGWLGEKVNWHAGFGAAAVGMAIGLAQYVLGSRHLRGVGDVPGHRLAPDERRKFVRYLLAGLAFAAAVVAILAGIGELTVDAVTVALTVLALVVPAVYLGYLLRSHEVTEDERARLRAYVWLFVGAAVFWMIYDQAPGPLNVFADEHVDLNFFGWRMPTSWTQNINPILIICFAAVFAWLWTTRWGRRVSTPQKFAFALVMVGLSFVVMSMAAADADGGRVTIAWLVAVYLLQVFGELSLSPVGLSVTTRLAPHAFAGQMMGVWFLATAAGDAVGGQVARLEDAWGDVRYFLTLGAFTIVAGAAMFAFVRSLRRLMGEEHAPPSTGGA